MLFKNLLDNSIKFNQNEIPEISIQYYQEENNHYFEFKDNGIGIAPEFHQLVFDMFKRLNTRDVYVGSGLGLSTLKKMLEKMDGSIQILESEPTQGSTFLASFPVINELDKSKSLQHKNSTVYA